MSTIINGTSSAITFPDSTVQNTAGLTSSSTQVCQAWVNYKPGTGIVASYNVSSVVTNGTGDFTVNFTNALSDANYAIQVSTNAGTATVAYVQGTQTTTQIPHIYTNRIDNQALYTPTNIYVSVFR